MDTILSKLVRLFLCASFLGLGFESLAGSSRSVAQIVSPIIVQSVANIGSSTGHGSFTQTGLSCGRSVSDEHVVDLPIPHVTFIG